MQTDRTAAIFLQVAVLAFLGCIVSFSYRFGSNPAIDYPRLLISDTQPVNHVFEDEEIASATAIQNSTFQSGMLYSGVGGATLPTTATSYLRVAALLLDSLASNKARLSGITQLLDVHMDPGKAAKSLSDQAANYRKIDDESGAFVLIEQVNDVFSFRDRFWKQVQRQSGA